MPREKSQQQDMDEIEKLATLFREDRLGFERERRRLIRETIEGYEDRRLREALEKQQRHLDRVLRKSGSSQNRLSLIQALFWDQVVNRFIPALQGTSSRINAAGGDGQHSAPAGHLSLVRGPDDEG